MNPKPTIVIRFTKDKRWKDRREICNNLRYLLNTNGYTHIGVCQDLVPNVSRETHIRYIGVDPEDVEDCIKKTIELIGSYEL